MSYPSSKEIRNYFDLFHLHTLRIFNILYWSLRNNLYGFLTFFTPADLRAPLLWIKMHPYVAFFGRCLGYFFLTKLLKVRMIIVCWLLIVGRSIKLSAVFHIRYQVLSVFPPFLLKVWKCRKQHNRRSIFWSFFAIWTVLRLRKVEFAIASYPSVSLRSFVSLETSIWRSDRDSNIR